MYMNQRGSKQVLCKDQFQDILAVPSDIFAPNAVVRIGLKWKRCVYQCQESYNILTKFYLLNNGFH